MLLYGQEPIKASYHPAKFSGYSYSGKGVIMVLVCHVILQDHVIKGSCNFMGGNPSWQVIALPSLVAIAVLVVEKCLVQLKGKVSHALAQIRHYCLPLKHMACHVHTHEISIRRHINLPMCPMKDFRSWSNMSTRTTNETYLKNFYQSGQKQRQE